MRHPLLFRHSGVDGVAAAAQGGRKFVDGLRSAAERIQARTGHCAGMDDAKGGEERREEFGRILTIRGRQNGDGVRSGARQGRLECGGGPALDGVVVPGEAGGGEGATGDVDPGGGVLLRATVEHA